MAHGESLRLKMLDLANQMRKIDPLPARGSRNRTLRGKARIKARKEANRRAAKGQW